MPQALPLTTKISQSSSKTTNFRTLISKFGNGYEQRTPDGINTKEDTWSIQYENLSTADKDTVVAAFDAVGGWDYITWTPFGDSSQKRFKLDQGYTLTPKSGNLFNISVSLVQVFDV